MCVFSFLATSLLDIEDLDRASPSCFSLARLVYSCSLFLLSAFLAMDAKLLAQLRSFKDKYHRCPGSSIPLGKAVRRVCNNSAEARRQKQEIVGDAPSICAATLAKLKAVMRQQAKCKPLTASQARFATNQRSLHGAQALAPALRAAPPVGRPPQPRQHPSPAKSTASCRSSSVGVAVQAFEERWVLHKMLGDFSEVMAGIAPHVPWMAHKGTLLSLCKHSGMCAWDDDVDIYIPLDNRQAFEKWWAELFPAIASALGARGWRVVQEYKCHRSPQAQQRSSCVDGFCYRS